MHVQFLCLTGISEQQEYKRQKNIKCVLDVEEDKKS